MNIKTLTASAFGAVALLISSLPIFSQTVTATWSQQEASPMNVMLYAGQQPGIYSTNWMLLTNSTATNAVIELPRLYPGTNYIALSNSREVSGQTNVTVSELSNVVIVNKSPAMAVRLSVTLQTSTNLTAWLDWSGAAYALLDADKSMQFFRPTTPSLKVGLEAPTPPFPTQQ